MLNRSIFYKTFIFILIVWVLFLLQYFAVINTDKLAIDKNNGLWSIITGTFLHGSFKHLVGNSQGLLITIPLILYLYKKSFFRLTIWGVLIPSALSYYLDMPSIGISGLVFAYLAFVISRGIGSKDKVRFLAAMVLILIYSGALMGITPSVSANINWQAHLAGASVGVLLTIISYLKKDGEKEI